MKKVKKLNLNKSVISTLNPEEKQLLKGGNVWPETSYASTCGCSGGSFNWACPTKCHGCYLDKLMRNI